MFKSLFNRTCGYSLLELLVAVAILGIVISPLLGLFTGAFSSIARAGQSCTAINLCREKMETVKAKGFEQVVDLYLTGSGSPFVEDNIPGQPAYRRTTTVTMLNPEEHNLPSHSELLAITITVSFKTGTTEYAESLDSRLARR